MTEQKLSVRLQKCQSIDDVIDAFLSIGFKKAHKLESGGQALKIEATERHYLNIVLVDQLPVNLQAQEKKTKVKFALYVDSTFNAYKFFDIYAKTRLDSAYTFSKAMLAEDSAENVTKKKLDGVKFDDIDTLHEIAKTTIEEAIKNFKKNLKAIIDSLRIEIDTKIQRNQKLQDAMSETVATFSSFIGYEFNKKALIELLIQHLLTKDIFSAAYGKGFHRGNNVAKSLDILAKCFDDVPTLMNDAHDLRERRDEVIQVIELYPDEERRDIIKLVYEAFYSVYDPKNADRLGIVYTPRIAVDFIIRSTDVLMDRHLGTRLHHKNTHIIDPCTGTGTFMLSLLDHIYENIQDEPSEFVYKYENELHANEVSILAYYIAAISVERLFEYKIHTSKKFPGVVWRDTLLTLNLDDFPVHGNDNIGRMRAQQNKKITVVMGNPPYNAGQKNFGDGNPNPQYFRNGIGVDDRISDTYVEHSQFNRQTRDMYKRFVRWASDRIGTRGIVSFISNNSFVHANNYDGMRKCLEMEFDHIYICDLLGDAHKSGKKWKEEGDKFFGHKSRVGIAIYFLVKLGEKKNGARAQIHYTSVGKKKTKSEKDDWITNRTIKDMKFELIKPDFANTWIGKKASREYREFIPLISYETKDDKNENSIFHTFTNGVKTGADDWLTDFEKNILGKKIQMYSKEYNRVRMSYHASKKPYDLQKEMKASVIQWYGDLDTKAKQNKIISYKKKCVYPTLYRPFLSKYFQYDKILVQRTYTWPNIFKSNEGLRTPALCVRARSTDKFECLAAYGFVDHGAITSSQIVPLYKLSETGILTTNTTEFGRTLFENHYEIDITNEQIFYYCYAALNDPVYNDKYGHETRTAFPHIPLHPEFLEWVNIGKKLFVLHAEYATQPQYNLTPIVEDKNKSSIILNLKCDNKKWKARIDGSFSLGGIPSEAADPKAGGYVIKAKTPIKWVLEYYQKACKPKENSKISKELATLDFISHRNTIINLVKSLCTVSVKTSQLQKELEKLPHSFIPCKKICCKKLIQKQHDTTKTSKMSNHKKRAARVKKDTCQRKLQ